MNSGLARRVCLSQNTREEQRGVLTCPVGDDIIFAIKYPLEMLRRRQAVDPLPEESRRLVRAGGMIVGASLPSSWRERGIPPQ